MIRELKFDTIGYVSSTYLNGNDLLSRDRPMLDKREVKYSFGVKDTYTTSYFVYEYQDVTRITRTEVYKPWYGLGFITSTRKVIDWEYSEIVYYNAVRIEADDIKETLLLSIKEAE